MGSLRGQILLRQLSGLGTKRGRLRGRGERKAKWNRSSQCVECKASTPVLPISLDRRWFPATFCPDLATTHVEAELSLTAARAPRHVRGSDQEEGMEFPGAALALRGNGFSGTVP